ncbi:MAG: SLBB domain-containing protein, partial [Candidatus Edwardsbacteria bacterium]|nr:SLBB domain-containing protein [Candidatus Edwardsbacteria bacterium]
ILPVVLLSTANAILGQGGAMIDRATGSSVITTASGEREVLIEVQIWGHVSRPGMYKVPVSTDVVGLISYAGGPTDYAALSRVKLVRSGIPKGAVVKLNMDKYTNSGDRSFIPMLESGDVVVVPTTRVHNISLFTAFISQAAVVITSYLVIAGKIK